MENSTKNEVMDNSHMSPKKNRLPSRIGFLFREDSDRAQLTIIFFTALFLGPALTYYLWHSDWLIMTKLNIAPIIYVSMLYIFYSTTNIIVNKIQNTFSIKNNNYIFAIEFIKFIIAFSLTYQYQTIFIFEPIFKAPKGFNFSFKIVTIISYSAVLASIFYRFRLMKNYALKSKVAEAEAQYSLLESQMQPHFLFNSLNVLSELIYVDPDLANAMSQKLADLYREVLHNSKAKFATLESEISILLKYIEIQKIRFGDRIHFEVEVSPAYYNLQLPSLMLQTLVENAIKHGISPKKEGGLIVLSVKKKGSLFEVCISNTGKLYKGHQESKRSTGLTNTKNRLELTYGSQSSFEIYSDQEKTYVKFLITGRTK